MTTGLVEDRAPSASASPNTRKPRNMLWSALVAVSLIGLMWFSRGQWLPGVYSYLNVSHPPQQAEYAVVLAGTCRTRAAAAAELFLHGYASDIAVSGAGRCLESSLHTLEEAGVPSTAVSVISPPGSSTWSEAANVLAFLEEEGATSALLITQGFHTRRVQWTYRRRARKQAVVLTVVETPREYFLPEVWWQSERGRLFVRSEYTKLIFYRLYYGTFAHQVMPPGRAVKMRRSVCRLLPAILCDLT